LRDIRRVLLDADVAEIFPDSQSVNEALRVSMHMPRGGNEGAFPTRA